VNVFGYDLEKDVVNAKRQLGLVPQEFNFNPFETVQQIVVNQAQGLERIIFSDSWVHQINATLYFIQHFTRAGYMLFHVDCQREF
ncbi:hypothetical protein MJL27_27210, partial [Salmonella enterica subsp. enterica serovar Anatum]|nr:hypothetical protein [Salmonella enterica subsp. enterica serovar Anatum]